MLQHKLEEGIKPGDLVWYFFGGLGGGKTLGVFLKLKTSEKKNILPLVLLQTTRKPVLFKAISSPKVPNANRGFI